MLLALVRKIGLQCTAQVVYEDGNLEVVYGIKMTATGNVIPLYYHWNKKHNVVIVEAVCCYLEVGDSLNGVKRWIEEVNRDIPVGCFDINPVHHSLSFIIVHEMDSIDDITAYLLASYTYDVMLMAKTIQQVAR